MCSVSVVSMHRCLTLNSPRHAVITPLNQPNPAVEAMIVNLNRATGLTGSTIARCSAIPEVDTARLIQLLRSLYSIFEYTSFALLAVDHVSLNVEFLHRSSKSSIVE